MSIEMKTLTIGSTTYEIVDEDARATAAQAASDIAAINFIPNPTIASVGQTIVVKAVDDAGKPIEWEPVDFPEHVQSDWSETDTTSDVYIANKPSKLSDFQNDLYYYNSELFLTLTEQDFTWMDDGTGMGYYTYEFSEPLDWLNGVDSIDYTVTGSQSGNEFVAFKTKNASCSDGAFYDDYLSIYSDGNKYLFDLNDGYYCKLDSFELKIIKHIVKKIPSDVIDLSQISNVFIEQEDSSNVFISQVYIDSDDKYENIPGVFYSQGEKKIKLFGDVYFLHLQAHVSCTLPSNVGASEVTNFNSSVNNGTSAILDAFSKRLLTRKSVIQLKITDVGEMLLYPLSLSGVSSSTTFTGTMMTESLELYGASLCVDDSCNTMTVTIKRFF